MFLATTGLLWAAMLVWALNSGPFAAVALLIPTALVATVPAVRAADPTRPRRRPRPAERPRKRRRRPMSSAMVVGVVASVLLPAVALAGPIAAVVVAVLVAGAGGFATLTDPRARRARLSLLVAALGPPIACMSMVLARQQGFNEALALAAALCAYDSAAFVMGNARTPVGGPFGIGAGALSIGVVGLLASAIMDPPFSGVRTWVLFGLVAVLAPVGVMLAGRFAGAVRVPGLRRVDSWILAAPAWVAGVAFLLHR